ncbi:MAG: hypothetical protein H8E87_04665 [FCB group bacterium]|nr:hypothetical protein [FCB group bacterium]
MPGGSLFFGNNIYHRRYFASHRIDWRITENLYAGVSEAVLYGGADRTFEWEYLNPFIFYHGEQQNYKSEGNTIICADFLWFPGKRWEIYGEVMIDDMQFDKKTLAEQEPAEIGWLFGFRKADPLGIDGMEIGIEHAAITPRTYNTLQPDQKFLHRNKPIAHPEGNDFILWMAEISKWVTPELQVKADFTFIRKGIDSISAVFDTSFYASDDYHESFPKGIVENRFQPGLELWYHLNHNWDFYFRGEYNFYDNYYHQEGKTEEKYLLRLGARLDLDWNFTAPKR